LDGEALLEWERVIEEMEAAGRLDKTDRAMISIYVRTWATHQVASRHVEQFGPVIKHSNGVVGENPFFKVQKATAVMLNKMLNDMGLTPAARGKGAGSPDAGGIGEF
jgi:P27 family predicted phage terminase small subunit